VEEINREKYRRADSMAAVRTLVLARHLAGEGVRTNREKYRSEDSIAGAANADVSEKRLDWIDCGIGSIAAWEGIRPPPPASGTVWAAAR
jgi:hypothetical protein